MGKNPELELCIRGIVTSYNNCNLKLSMLCEEFHKIIIMNVLDFILEMKSRHKEVVLKCEQRTSYSVRVLVKKVHLPKTR